MLKKSVGHAAGIQAISRIWAKGLKLARCVHSESAAKTGSHSLSAPDANGVNCKQCDSRCEYSLMKWDVGTPKCIYMRLDEFAPYVIQNLL
jgi:hypothetical protein